MTGTLNGKVALVTGGGRGIGRTVALMLAREGAAVAALGRTLETLEETVSAIEAEGGRAMACVCDVLEQAQIAETVAMVQQQLGAISVLVNNAGVGGAAGPLWKTDPEEWWWVQEVNVKGPYLMMHAVLESMVDQQQGCIINMGSYRGIFADPYSAAYATSKAALLRISDSVAAEVADSGVTVFCISPGLVETDMTRDLEAIIREHDPDFEGFDQAYMFPAEAAATLCMRLASGEADKLTGRMIHVKDDLDTMIRDADNIIESDRYALRLTVDLDD